METVTVFFYILYFSNAPTGSRCFFDQPQPQRTTAAPCCAIVQPCPAPTVKLNRQAGVGDTIPVNTVDTFYFARIIDFQE
jgi:hypothetical protein